ncbi:MAG: hypothetical protein R2854_11395 [Caldilineaceae bacterium]
MSGTVETRRLDLPLLLPEMEEGDACVALLTRRLASVRGIEQAHIVHTDGTGTPCLHYDPNLVSLARLERLAQQAGAEITARYRHELLPFAGLDAADSATSLAQALNDLPGMLHAGVNYAAGLVDVAYDSEELAPDAIQRTLRAWGASVVGPRRPQGNGGPAAVRAVPMPAESTTTATAAAPVERQRTAAVEADHEHEHDHGSAPLSPPLVPGALDAHSGGAGRDLPGAGLGGGAFSGAAHRGCDHAVCPRLSHRRLRRGHPRRARVAARPVRHRCAHVGGGAGRGRAG